MNQIETSKEPEVIAELRGWHREGCESLFTIGEVLAVDIPAILAAYDTIVAERDALTACLAACQRMVKAASRVIDADTDVLQAVAIVMLREAFAAETQTTPHAGGNDA